MKCRTVKCITVQCTYQCSSVQYSAVQCTVILVYNVRTSALWHNISDFKTAAWKAGGGQLAGRQEGGLRQPLLLGLGKLLLNVRREAGDVKRKGGGLGCLEAWRGVPPVGGSMC